MIKTHKDLEIWQESIELVINIYKTLEKFPDSEKFVLASQMQRAVISIPSNIAEGAARQSRKEFIKYFIYSSWIFIRVRNTVDYI